MQYSVNRMDNSCDCYDEEKRVGDVIWRVIARERQKNNNVTIVYSGLIGQRCQGSREKEDEEKEKKKRMPAFRQTSS